ncbi:hypothetical protein HAP94_04500 [Acidithiobacillus ferrivorans]|nr:hypothetical protein [Acidithiobacillus ferrivorans]
MYTDFPIHSNIENLKFGLSRSTGGFLTALHDELNELITVTDNEKIRSAAIHLRNLVHEEKENRDEIDRLIDEAYHWACTTKKPSTLNNIIIH